MGVRVFIVCLAVFWIAQADAKKCLQCVDMPHPFDCNLITECTSSELCFVEQFITSSGLVLYNSGCRSKQRCSAVKRDIGKLVKRQDELLSKQDLVTCIQCCPDEFCNTEGCNDKAPPRDKRGPKCFDCVNQLAPEKCRDTVTCDSGMVCALERNPTNFQEWTSKCSQKLQCEALVNLQMQNQMPFIGKRDVITVKKCPRCCTEDYCNDDCGHNVTLTTTTKFPPTTKLQSTTSKLIPTATSSGSGTTSHAGLNANTSTSHVGTHGIQKSSTAKPTTKHSAPLTTKSHHHITAKPTTKHTNSITTKSHHHHTDKPTTKHSVPITTKSHHHHTDKPTTKQTNSITTKSHHHHTDKPTTKHSAPITTKSHHHHTDKPTTKHTNPPTTMKPTTTPHLITTPNPSIMCKSQGYIYDTPTRLCLKFYTTQKLNWTDAQNVCKKHHGRLVVVTSDLKKRDVNHYLSSKNEYQGLKFWVGATEISHVHTFTWTNGKTIVVDDYEKYDLTKTNCLLTGNPKPSVTYDPCPERNSFICENSNYIRP